MSILETTRNMAPGGQFLHRLKTLLFCQDDNNMVKI